MIVSFVELAILWTSFLSNAGDDEEEIVEQEEYLKERREKKRKGNKR